MNSITEITIWTSSKFRTVLTALLVGVAFYFGAALGLSLSTPPDYIAAFWPPNTFVLAALLLTDRRRWWIYFLAMTPAYLYAALESGYSAHRTIIFYTANCTEIIIAAFAMKYAFGNRLIKFDHFHEMVIFLLWAVLVAPVISAFIASITTLNEPDVSYWLAWRVWFLGDALGHLALTPVLILWVSCISSGLALAGPISFNRIIESLFFVFCLFTVSFFLLGAEIGSLHNFPALLYTPLPVFLWAAIRFGPRAVCSTVFVITLLAIWNAINGRGPFTDFSPADNVLSLQLFLIAISVPSMLLSSLLSERKYAEIALQEKALLLKNVLDSSPDFIFVKNTELQTILANKAYASAVGKTPEELVGHTDIENEWDPEWVYGNSAKGFREFEQDDKAVLAGESIHNLYDLADVTGEIRVFDTHKLPLYGLNGQIIGVLGIARDTTERIKAEQALRESDERWQFALEGCHDGVWDWNVVTDEVFFSPRFKEMLGYEEADIGSNLDEWRKRIHPDDKDRVYADIYRHFDQKKSIYENEYRMLCKDGSYKWRLARGKVVSWTDDNKPLRMIGTHMDITERKRTEEKLRLSSLVFSETSEGIMITDTTSSIIEVNPAFCNITGYSREEVIGQNSRILSSGKQDFEFYAEMWQTIKEHGQWQGELWNRKKDGTLYAELLSISSILEETGNVLHYVGIFSDITHSKQQQEKLVLMAHYDVLTQLPNRVLLADRFTLALAHSKRNETLLAVCFLDLDSFKPVNDRYGHNAGDQLLIEVAERIKAAISEEDTVSRQGGDEFALLLGDIKSVAHCEQLLESILHSLARPYFIDDHSISISASIGASLYPKDDADLDTLMRHADQSMYQAKLTGRNCYSLFNAEQNQLAIQKKIRLQEIQKAVSNNEFCLYYQPKVNMATGKVFGAEALIRWLHPEKGLIPPLKFLPVIEGTDTEILMGDWVINEALKQLDSWKKQGIELELSVNISSCHLQSPSFVVNLGEALARFPLVNANYFQLEILETSELGDLESISNIFKSCMHTLGVNIALDDFGTGYSSLVHLKNLFAKTIKIDRTFVRDVLDDQSDYAIIEGVIALANSFNRKVIAEGVETTEHGLMLLLMGCNEAQGYGIAKPMPAGDFPDWLAGYIPNQEWLVCGKGVRTLKETKMQLFRLVLNQWQKYFESNIQSSPDNIEHWPIRKKTKCHCGVWIKRAIDELILEENCIKKLDEVHDSMHEVADDLFNKYQKGEIDTARDELTEFRIAFEQISNVLGQCEEKFVS